MSFKGTKPTILLVHGAWHVPMHYAKLSMGLARAGFDTITPHLPTEGRVGFSRKKMTDDVAFIHSEAEKIVDKGLSVIVVCHSYGGMVVTNAITSNLSIQARKKEKKTGGILHIVYMAAFLPQIGESLVGVASEKNKPSNKTSPKKETIRIDEDGASYFTDAIATLYGDVAEDEAIQLSNMLVSHPISSFTETTHHTAWLYFPITYLFCQLDQAISFHLQQAMVQSVMEAGIQVRTESFQTGHFPFLTISSEVVAAIQRAWEIYAAEECI